MKEQNLDFLDAYQALDQHCGKMYRSKFGITNYIDHMKQESLEGAQMVEYWDFILERLIHYRQLRNKLMHDTASFEHTVCAQSDINWIDDFHQSILNRTDPISVLLRKRVKEKQALKEFEKANPSPETILHKRLQMVLVILTVILLFIVWNLILLWI